MGTRIFFSLVLLLSVTALSAQSIIRKSGKCSVQIASAFDDSKMFVVEMSNEDIKIVYRISGSEFFGRFVLKSSPRVTNLSGESKHVEISMAFFDKEGNLVACSSGTTDMKKDTENMQTGSGMPGVPKSNIAEITSYQAVVYISTGKDPSP